MYIPLPNGPRHYHLGKRILAIFFHIIHNLWWKMQTFGIRVSENFLIHGALPTQICRSGRHCVQSNKMNKAMLMGRNSYFWKQLCPGDASANHQKLGTHSDWVWNIGWAEMSTPFFVLHFFEIKTVAVQLHSESSHGAVMVEMDVVHNLYLVNSLRPSHLVT